MSPGFPVSYANDLSCDWDVICPGGNKIILTFTDIDVEYAGSNCFDSIKVTMKEMYILIYINIYIYEQAMTQIKKLTSTFEERKKNHNHLNW